MNFSLRSPSRGWRTAPVTASPLRRPVLRTWASDDVDVVGAGQVARGPDERVVVEDVEDPGDRDQDVVLADLRQGRRRRSGRSRPGRPGGCGCGRGSGRGGGCGRRGLEVVVVVAGALVAWPPWPLLALWLLWLPCVLWLRSPPCWRLPCWRRGRRAGGRPLARPGGHPAGDPSAGRSCGRCCPGRRCWSVALVVGLGRGGTAVAVGRGPGAVDARPAASRTARPAGCCRRWAGSRPAPRRRAHRRGGWPPGARGGGLRGGGWRAEPPAWRSLMASISWPLRIFAVPLMPSSPARPCSSASTMPDRPVERLRAGLVAEGSEEPSADCPRRARRGDRWCRTLMGPSWGDGPRVAAPVGCSVPLTGRHRGGSLTRFLGRAAPRDPPGSTGPCPADTGRRSVGSHGGRRSAARGDRESWRGTGHIVASGATASVTPSGPIRSRPRKLAAVSR